MLSLGSLAFLNPWMLAALGLLPVIWWLVRVTPPPPRHVAFPALRLMLDLPRRETTPSRTPWWLLVLRLAIAALVILALAHPLLNPSLRLAGNGPVLLVVDDGWASAGGWQRRLDALADLADQADRAGRPVALLTTAAPASGEAIRVGRLLRASEIRGQIRSLKPKPWPTDRARAAQAVAAAGLPAQAEAVWLSDGYDDGGAAALAEALRTFPTLQVFLPARSDTAKLLLPPTLDGAQLKLNARRLGGGPAETLVVRAVADRGEVLARERLEFVADAVIATAPLALPTELRNRVARIEVEGERSAGTTVLLDERWRRRPVGLVAGGTLETDQPLLSDLYYLTRALNPFVELREGSVDALLKRPLAVMVLADVGQVVGGDFSALENWVEKGGVLLRFAGPRLAQSADALVPVKLRGGGRRSLDGAMSWAQPARMAEFPAESPFFGLAVPDDVVVRRQVLAEPARDLARKTWARLSDGTPLVTGEKRGAGWVILVHTTANTAWSSLPLSGMFVEMLRRVVALSQGVAGQEGAGGAMPPLSMLDAFGVLGPPNSGILPLTDSVEGTRVSPKQPPGFYGTQDARRALNLGPSVGEPRPLPPMPSGALSAEYSGARELDLLPWLLVAALSLGLIDLIASLALRGLLPWRLGVAGAAMLACMVVSPPRPAAADDKAALLGTLETKLAYVLTGNREVDEISRNGMRGLSDMLNRRTSIEPTEPVGLDIERDEILFYPFVYWPVIAEQKDLSPAALAKLDHFMKTGGTVLFDTRDAGQIVPFVESGGQGARRLRALLSKLDIPPLVPVPPDHVLTKAFYLLQEFPGRYAGGPLWVERHSENVNDGVASVIIGGNDWAAAWATDTEGRPLYAISPGGERQRETAFRFGINLLMYVMTGNYKADQVHVPAILERLGQ